MQQIMNLLIYPSIVAGILLLAIFIFIYLTDLRKERKERVITFHRFLSVLIKARNKLRVQPV
jgi:hypothetical protein